MSGLGAKWATVPGRAEARFDLIGRRVLLLGLAVAGIAANRGFPEPVIHVAVDRALQVLLFGLYVTDLGWSQYRGRLPMEDVRTGWLAVVIHALAFAAALLGALAGVDNAWWVFEAAIGIGLVVQLGLLVTALARTLHRPDLLLPGGFLVLIVLGTLLLKMPRASADPGSLAWVDALFTMTSAVCVTGLIVKDTAADFTPLGQTLIGAFIQLGGLNIVVFSSLLALLLGQRASVKEQVSLAQALSDQPLSSVRRLVQFVIWTTLACEVIGALLMMPLWHGEITMARRLGLSVFHAVSAFCNAGFALQADSFESYRWSLLPHLVVAPLIVLGGLGFHVLADLWKSLRHKGAYLVCTGHVRPRPPRWSLNTRLVLVMTLALYLGGMATMVIARLTPILGEHHSRSARLATAALDAHFMSITARTAGFNTVPMAELTRGETLTLMGLMLVGGSPGGTAGGMKTTTLAVLLLALLATVLGRPSTEAFGRTVQDPTIRKAAVIAACHLLWIALATLVMCLSEPFALDHIAFEVISAATTTGLSLGITADLSTTGKLMLVLCMFVGRVGPLAVLATLAFSQPTPAQYAYPTEDVNLG